MNDFYDVLDDLDYPPGSRRIADSRQPGFSQGIELPARRYLGAPLSTHPEESFLDEEFAMGERQMVRGKLTVEVDYDGIPMDFTFGALNMPVLNSAAADVFRRFAQQDIQLIPAIVESRSEQYFILNAVRLLDCIDHEHSVIQYWPENEEERTEKAGKPRMVVELRLNRAAIPPDMHVFRLRIGRPR